MKKAMVFYILLAALVSTASCELPQKSEDAGPLDESLLLPCLLSDEADAVRCAVEYLAEQGGPAVPENQPAGPEEIRKIAQQQFEWLRGQDEEKLAQLVEGFKKFRWRWEIGQLHWDAPLQESFESPESESGEPPFPPEQPAKGPGGKEYKHKKVVENTYGRGGKQYWLFEPDDPKPKKAPLIVFNHGWGGMSPRFYRKWLEHIVKRGNIVVYPRYQNSLLTPPAQFTPNAIHALKAAIKELESGTHVKPDRDKAAVVGHSMGGMLSANLAAVAEAEGLPQFKAVMPVEPGGPRDTLEDCSKIPADTLLLCVAGEDDGFVGDKTALRILKNATNVAKENKNLVTVCTDCRGEPFLNAGHFAPTDRTLDALDWYGFWKWFDALCDAAFHNRNREHALGDTPEQRFMGKWSDGRPVREAKVTDVP